MLPGPKSVATKMASGPAQSTVPFASGSAKPPSSGTTNALARRSNSRVTTASAPPRESRTRQRP